MKSNLVVKCTYCGGSIVVGQEPAVLIGETGPNGGMFYMCEDCYNGEPGQLTVVSAIKLGKMVLADRIAEDEDGF